MIAVQIGLIVIFAICAVQVVRHWGTPAGIAWSAGALASSYAYLSLLGD